MKKTSKALLLGLCAVLLVAASILGTMAYLTDNAEVANSFTVGKVRITLDEALVGNDGKELMGKDAKRVNGNTYKLVPGVTYDKDPTIYVNEESEDCYLFVTVEDGIKALEDENNTVEAQMIADGKWKLVKDNVYVYTNGKNNPERVTATAGKNGIEVFEHFAVKNTATEQDLIANKDNKIIVTAYAVQADGWDTNSALEIWNNAGFKTTNNN